MKHILVLGGGRVGSAIAYDLSKKYSITVADIDKDTLRKVRKKNSREIYILKRKGRVMKCYT